MSDILAISSHVSFGAVGNAIAVPAMEASGLQVSSLPSIILSNHPGLGKPVGMAIPDQVFTDMLDTLAAGHWLDNLQAIMTGYFATPAQVMAASQFITAQKHLNPKLVYLCDPVIGDEHTGLYVATEIATAIRDYLLPLATIITPNNFELAWLSNHQINHLDEAVIAARSLPAGQTLATSLPADQHSLITALIDDTKTQYVKTARRNNIPHGTGDLLAGLYLSLSLIDANPLAPAMARLEACLNINKDAVTLRLPRREDWQNINHHDIAVHQL